MEQLTQLLPWNSWANGVVGDVVYACEDLPDPALAAFQHIFEAELTWLRRMQGVENPNAPLWGEATVERTREWHAEADRRMAQLLSNLSSGDVESTFTYQNSTGREFTDRLDETLMHALLHSQQYRGECAAFLNAAGHRVPDFDYIFWLRHGSPRRSVP